MPFCHINENALEEARNTINGPPEARPAPEPQTPRRADDARDGLLVLAIAVLIWWAVRAAISG